MNINGVHVPDEGWIIKGNRYPPRRIGLASHVVAWLFTKMRLVPMSWYVRACKRAEDAEAELDGIKSEIRCSERIRSGEWVDDTHIEWREGDIEIINMPGRPKPMEAWCVHCGNRRPGIAGKYKGKWVFERCRCSSTADKQLATLEQIRDATCKS